MTPELVVRWAGGSLNLMGWNDSPYGEYQVEALADGTDWGNIESVRRELRTALRDGSRTTRENDRNRTIAMALRVSSSSHSALAYGEQQIDLLDGLRCELVWTPPARLGIAPSVFVIDYSELEHRMDDQGYERGELEYALTMSALPHAYADSWITLPAVVQGSSIPVTVDDCTSATGWSVFGGTVSASGDKLVFTSAGGARGMTATRTGPVDLTTDRRLAAWTDHPTSVQVLNGSTWTTLPFEGVDGSYEVYDATGLADPTIDAMRFVWAVPDAVPTAKSLVDIRKQSAPRSTSSRQQTRTVTVPGSRRTSASVLVKSESEDDLGEVLVYSGPNYNPAMSRGAMGFRSTTSATLSGAVSNVPSGPDTPGFGEQFQVPASDFFPGSHSIWARCNGTAGGVATSGTVIIEVSLFSPIAELLTRKTVRRYMTYAAGTPTVDLFGTVDLPGAELGAAARQSFVRVEVRWDKDDVATPGGSDLQVDEVLLFNRTVGRLVKTSYLDEARLWIDAANLECDHDMVYKAKRYTEKDYAAPLLLSSELVAWSGAISMTPGTTYLYVGTTAANGATVEATFRPAGNTHMPELV